MNYMEQVAEMLGVELEEVFGIKGHSPIHRYRITESGVEYHDITERWYSLSPDLLNKILTGQCEIKKLPWEPATGEDYFMPYISGGEADFERNSYWSSDCDKKRYEAGLVCKTKNEAIEKAGKMLAALKED